MWLFEVPLLYNDFLANTTFFSSTFGTKFVEAGIIKLGHLTNASMETLGDIINIRSSRVLRRIVEEIWQSLSVPLRVFTKNHALVDQWSEEKYICPSMIVSPAVVQVLSAQSLMIMVLLIWVLLIQVQLVWILHNQFSCTHTETACMYSRFYFF